jgi:D-alanyl-lipoteichoic acid acyltransferase DltB (MBOAT superfamily)
MLLLASLVFYAWWRPIFVPSLVGSIVTNYGLVRVMRRSAHPRGWLIAGLIGNLGLLG